MPHKHKVNPIRFENAEANLELSSSVLDSLAGDGIQSVIRAEVVAGNSTIVDPYALLKELTRGRRVGAVKLREFVEGLEISDAARRRLLAVIAGHLHGARVGDRRATLTGATIRIRVRRAGAGRCAAPAG